MKLTRVKPFVGIDAPKQGALRVTPFFWRQAGEEGNGDKLT
jgi:hypothetical protein